MKTRSSKTINPEVTSFQYHRQRQGEALYLMQTVGNTVHPVDGSVGRAPTPAPPKNTAVGKKGRRGRSWAIAR